MPTRLAEAQMHPAIARFEAFFTAIGVGCHVMNLVEVRTGCTHHFCFELV